MTGQLGTTQAVNPVAKSKRIPDPDPKPAPPPPDKQVNFRAPGRLYASLEDVADALGVDVSNLVRMILNENLAKYRERADRVRSGLPASPDA